MTLDPQVILMILGVVAFWGRLEYRLGNIDARISRIERNGYGTKDSKP